MQYGVDIKRLQSDDYGEFQTLEKLLFQRGYHMRIKCPYTTSLNGVIERKHRHVVKIDLYLIIRADLSIQFWEHAFRHAMHLINIMLSKALLHKTPYELLYNQKPFYDHLKTFGCLCYRYIYSYNSNKLEPKYFTCVFLDYPPHQKRVLMYGCSHQTCIYEPSFGVS